MTVMVTGASGPIGRALVPLLVRSDEVRAAVRRPEAAEPLRALGAKVAVGRLDDADALAEVLSGCSRSIHLVGGPDQPDDDPLGANHGSVLRRSRPREEAASGASSSSRSRAPRRMRPDPLPSGEGLAEEAVTTAGCEHAVIRSTHVVGAGSLWFAATVAGARSPPVVVGDGRDSRSPRSRSSDLAAVLAAADDREGALAGTWALEGPDVVTADAVVRLLAGEPVARPAPSHGDEARARLEIRSGCGRRRRTPLDVFAAPSRADAPDAAAAFDVPRTPLARRGSRAHSARPRRPSGPGTAR